MDVVSLIGAGAVAFWASAVMTRMAAVVATFVQPRLRRRQATRRDQPAVTVVIPVKNLEPEMRAATESIFSQDYPEFEVLISAAEETSPALENARQAAHRFPHIPTRFLTGNKCFTLNPKVSNVAPAVAAAAHDLILIKDSNAQLSDGQLADLVRNLTSDTGMVCAVPIGMRPMTFWAWVECAVMNGHDVPLLMAASILRLDIGFGKVMLFRRPDFERIDGIAAMTDTFGDDHALAKAFARAGLRSVFAASVIRQALGARTLRDVWQRQLRWMAVRRDEEPFAFYTEPLASGYFATAAAAVAAVSLGLAPAVAALGTVAFWLASEALVAIGRGWGWSTKLSVAAVCREPLMLALWLRTWTVRKVHWQGSSFDLSGSVQ